MNSNASYIDEGSALLKYQGYLYRIRNIVMTDYEWESQTVQ